METVCDIVAIFGIALYPYVLFLIKLYLVFFKICNGVEMYII